MSKESFSSNISTISSYNSSHSDASTPTGSGSFSPRKIKRYFKNSTYLPFVIVGVLVLLVGIFAVKSVMGKSPTTSSAISSVLPASDSRANVQKPKSQQVLNREFSFPLKDQTGKVISQLKYEIQNVELRDEIVVKGERATAIKGRTFLIANLKIRNDFDKSIQLNARDYLRLIVANSTDKLAPDIHNDPVEVQALSTKFTRVGFPINDTDKDLTLQVGEITGKKDLIKLDLK